MNNNNGYIISKRQLNLLLEQGSITPLGNPYTSSGQKNIEVLGKSMDPKVANTILQIGTAFIPLIGPAISMGFMGFDFMEDYKKAKTDQERSNVIFSYVVTMATAWGLGKIFKSISEIGEEGMKILGKKLRTLGAWKALSAKESAVLLDLSNAPQYWQEKLKSSVKK